VTIRAGDNLKALLARVKRASSARGKKKELAKYLGVSHVCVSQWLSARFAPNGEVTLQMLAWVQAEEAKQNAPGSADTTARGKARSTHTIYETRRTNPRAKYRGKKQ
jgi:DNA-binding transcriptional regulator YdaS (Cro superfamily)